MSQDSEHLKLLAIFHYVVAGMTALFACIPFIHFFMGLALAPGALPDTDPEAQPIGIFIMVFAGLFIVAGWTLAALIAYAGRSLQTRRRYTFCLVMAGVECMFMPFGTVLGVFTIIVLMRDSVKGLFGRPVAIDPAPLLRSHSRERRQMVSLGREPQGYQFKKRVSREAATEKRVASAFPKNPSPPSGAYGV